MLKRLLLLMIAGFAILPLQAGAWVGYHGGGFHAGAGGFTSWHHGGWGGGAWGGATHVGYGGVTHVGYGGATHVGYGGVYHAGYGGAYYHPAYGGGCWGCVSNAGAVAAAGVVGLAAGAAIGSAAASSPTVVVQQPVYVTGPSIGTETLSLPGGCSSTAVNGVQYYNCGGSFYQPHFGSNGVYYTVVPNPF